MKHPSEDIMNYMKSGARVHLSGIGGVSMCALAEVLQGMGMEVQGSDMMESATVEHLRSVGIPVSVGHSADNIGACDVVIRTAAIRDSNPEIAGAVARGIPVYERAQAWGAIMRSYENALCISGTHGKTTTTSMATHIFMSAHRDPTVMIGGTLPLLGKGYRVGGGDTIILESCEYCNSFLSFYPTVAVVLNVAADHLDFFKDLADIQHSFRAFADLVPDRGMVVANWDDEGVRATMKDYSRPLCRCSVKDKSVEVYAENVSFFDGFGDFDVIAEGKHYAHVSLRVPGSHNVSNALCAAAAAYVLGVDGSAVEQGLHDFIGAGRRFEYKGEFNGAKVYDDYAHHPDELCALLKAARSLPHKRLICAFQPHTYTRTAALFDEFIAEMRKADVAIVAEIYAAREKNDSGISSRDLCAHIDGSHYCATLQQVTDTLAAIIEPEDLVLTVGAGDIYRAGEELIKRG